MTSSDLLNDLDPGRLVALNMILDRFEADCIAGVSPPIEQIRDQVEPRCRRYVVIRCVEVELEQAKLVTPQDIAACLLRFPEYEHELQRTFESWQREQARTESTVPQPSAEPQPEPSADDPAEFPKLSDADSCAFIKKLGAGTFGVVYLAHSLKLKQDVAVKVLKQPAPSASGHKSQAIPEVQVLQSLNHPGIVRLLGLETTLAGTTALILEFVDGPTLRQLLNENHGKLPQQQAVHIVTETVRALVYVHQQGIFHLDLKPSNILIRKTAGNPQPLIADFGGSVFRKHRLASSGCTLEYAAPELFGQWYADYRASDHWHLPGARSDLYSVGVMLYLLLTGEYPFDLKKQKEANGWVTLLNSRRQRPETPRSIDSAIPPRLSDICLRCLEFHPENRFSSASDLLDALDALKSPEEPAGNSTAENLLRLRPLTSRDRLFYRKVLDTVPHSSLNTQINPLIRQILPAEDTDNSIAPPKILALSAPSGAGKSTWFTAGILPTLRERDLRDAVTVVVLNAEETAAAADTGTENTAERLRQHLIQRLSLPLATAMSLEEILTAWKTIAGPQPDLKHTPRKLLIVFDQFEQWLSVHGSRTATQLHQLLRLCDGHLLQTLLIFRSDFIDRAEKLMRDCYSNRADGSSGFSIDPLTAEEASAVLEQLLATFSNTLHRSGDADSTSTLQHARRLLSDVAGYHGGVCPAWIVMIARFLNKHATEPLLLQSQNSLSDIALSHLRELLEGSSQSQPSLASLYPDIIRCLIDNQAGGELRQQVSFRQFHNASLKSTSADDLRFALQRLEAGDLIMSMQVTTAGQQEQVWQLTHEVWARPLKQWLEQISRTKAESLLSDRTVAWVRKHESRHLLNTPELVHVLRHVPAERRSPDHTEFIGRSLRRVTGNWLIVVLVAVFLPLWLIFARMEWSIRAGNFGREPLVAEFSHVPWYARRLVMSNMNAELENRQRTFADASPQERQQQTLPLRLALLNLLDENSDQFRRESETLISQMNSVPDKFREDALHVVQRHAAVIQQTATSRFDRELAAAGPPEQASLRADHAVLMFLLGKLQECDSVLTDDDQDYSDRTLFISRLAPWLLVPEARNALQDSALTALPKTLSAVLTALDQQPEPLKELDTFLKNCLASDDASVASASEYLMQTWNIQAPAAGSTKQSGKGWARIPAFRLFLIRLELPADPAADDAEQIFWGARTELTVGQIRAIAPHLLREDETPEKDDQPAVKRTLDDLLEIIGVLNQRCGFPATWKKTENVWFPVPGARGFRVLMLREGLHLAGAGCPSARPLGKYLEDELYFNELPKYAHGQTMAGTERNQSAAVGSKRPNAFGFVDCLGNVSEVVLDQFRDGHLPPGSRFADSFAQFTIGGDFNNAVQFMRLDELGWIPWGGGPRDLDDITGFRFVCDAPEADIRGLVAPAPK